MSAPATVDCADLSALQDAAAAAHEHLVTRRAVVAYAAQVWVKHSHPDHEAGLRRAVDELDQAEAESRRAARVASAAFDVKYPGKRAALGLL